MDGRARLRRWVRVWHTGIQHECEGRPADQRCSRSWERLVVPELNDDWSCPTARLNDNRTCFILGPPGTCFRSSPAHTLASPAPIASLSPRAGGHLAT